MQNAKENKKRFMSWPQIVIVTIAAFIGLYIFLAAIPFVGPYFQYPLYVIKCGGQPIIASDFMSRTYKTPNERSYSVKGNSRLFCTEQEATDAGYSKLD